MCNIVLLSVSDGTRRPDRDSESIGYWFDFSTAHPLPSSLIVQMGYNRFSTPCIIRGLLDQCLRASGGIGKFDSSESLVRVLELNH